MPRQRRLVFNTWKSIAIDFSGNVPADAAARADVTFEALKPHLGTSKLLEKARDWRPIHYALEQAAGKRAAVVFHRNRNHPDYRSIRIQLMDAAIATGLVEEERALKGSPKASRIIPKSIKPVAQTVFVILRDRKTKSELPINWSNPIAADMQSKLRTVNATNANWEITIEPWDFWTREWDSRKRIRPIHRAIFTENFDLHGRIYGSHQKHGKEARATIRFNGAKSVELDFEGFHPRALYHSEGVPYRSDPYRLWEDTSPEMRLMAKTVINVALNAKTRRGAISACNEAMNQWADGRRKDGRELERAIKLQSAAETTGLKFADVYELAVEKHRPIAHHFGSDAGLRLMRRDSKVALAILFSFASQGVPCLGIHDSFVVPESQEHELRRLMIAFYRQEFGFEPVIKG